MGIQASNPFENDDILERDQAIEEAPDAHELTEPVVLDDIDHIALAVLDLDDALASYRDDFGLVVDEREIIDDDGAEVASLRVGASHIHLLAPVGEASWLGDFLDQAGPGLHHVGYRVADVADAHSRLVASGYEAIDSEPRPGLGGRSVAFLQPPDGSATLIQLVESR